MKIANARADRLTSFFVRGTLWIRFAESHGWRHVSAYDKPDIVLASKVSDERFFVGLNALAKSAKIIYDLDDELEEMPEPLRSMNVAFASKSHMVTCSTPHLLEYAKKRLNKNSILVPNCLPDTLYEPASAQRGHRIYCGGRSEQVGHFLNIASDVDKVLDEKLFDGVTLGGLEIPRNSRHRDKYAVVSWEDDYLVYLGWLRQAPLSLAVIPTGGYKSKYKSNLKFLTYVAAGIPTLFSDVEPYSECGEGVKDGFWYKAMRDNIPKIGIQREICLDKFTTQRVLPSLFRLLA